MIVTFACLAACRRVLWYSLFVALYLIVLYLQASAYKSADVVATLRNALMVDGQLSMTFNNEEEVLAYLGNKILLPTWQDPVCGDGALPVHWRLFQVVRVFAFDDAPTFGVIVCSLWTASLVPLSAAEEVLAYLLRKVLLPLWQHVHRSRVYMAGLLVRRTKRTTEQILCCSHGWQVV